MITATVNTYRNAYAGLSRDTWLLSLIMLINRSGTMVVPFMTLYLTQMGYSISQAGFVFGMFGLGAFAGAYLGGKLTDRIGFYPVQLITLIGGGILFFVLGQMQSYSLICLFTFILSFVNEAFRPANSTAIAFYSKEENRTRSYALNRLAINVGWAVGSGVGGVIAKIDYHMLFWVDGATNISAAIIMLLFLRPVGYKPQHKEGDHAKQTRSAYKDKTYLWFILYTTLFALCFFQLFNNLPLFFKRDLHLSEPTIGFLLAMNGIWIAVFEMILIYRLEGKRKNSVYISLGVALTGMSFLMLAIPGIGVITAFLMLCLVTIGEIFSLPFMNTYWISRTDHDNRGQYAALYSMAWSAAQTLGPMMGSQVADHFGFMTLWASLGVLCILLSFALRRMH